MDKHFLINILILFSISKCFSQVSYNEKTTYSTIEIGKQVWMNENLNVSRFRNGDSIYEAKSVEEWQSAGKEAKPAWCYYNNLEIIGNTCGKLYNWYAVNDPRGLAPQDWRIPTNQDWNDYAKFFKKDNVSDTYKEIKRRILSSGFVFFPCGLREKDDRDEPIDESLFSSLWGRGTFFWSSTLNNDKEYGFPMFSANFFGIPMLSIGLTFESHENLVPFGFSVRCIK